MTTPPDFVWLVPPIGGNWDDASYLATRDDLTEQGWPQYTRAPLSPAVLADVPRINGDRHFLVSDVLAALSRALDGVTERAGEVVAQANQMIDFLSGQDTLDGMGFGDPNEKGHRFWWRKYLSRFEAMDDLITALLAQNAALRAERDEARAAHDADQKAYLAAWNRAETAEAEVEKLRGALYPLSALPIGDRTADDVPLYGLDERYITHGDIRRARAALTTENQTNG